MSDKPAYFTCLLIYTNRKNVQAKTVSFAISHNEHSVIKSTDKS